MRARIKDILVIIVLFLLAIPAVSAQESRKEEACEPFFSVRTNALYDLAAVPNLGVEVRVGRRFTVKADWMYAWWYSDARHWYWQTYGGYFGFRQYFGRRSKESPFTGHHIGAYGLAMTYDVEWGGRGYQAARWGFGGGVEYGYSFPISKRFNIDVSLGVGYQDGEYKTYDPIDGHYVWQGTYLRHWYGPTKAEVSLVWVLGRSKKEGGR